MGRVVYLMLGIVAINLALMIFSCDTWTTTGECGVPSSAMWSWLLGPNVATSTSFWNYLFGTATGLASVVGTILFIGSFFLKVEFPIYAGITIALAPMVYSWIKFWNQLGGAKIFAGHPEVATIIGIILLAPIVVTYIFTILDWARGRD